MRGGPLVWRSFVSSRPGLPQLSSWLDWPYPSGYNSQMERVGISKLKDQLSAYLKRVQAGETVLVMDRGKPVARLERADPELEEDARYRRLVASGIIRPGKRPVRAAPIRPVDLGPNPGVLEALLEERREGR